MKHPEFLPSSLVAENKDRGASEIGVQGTISIAPDASVILLTNDQSGGYVNNRGSVTASWDVSES